MIARIWAEVLDLPLVGVNDPFFELGGDSLLATQVVSRIRETLGIDLPLRHLFETPTVAALAGRFADAVGEGRAARRAMITPQVDHDPAPLSFSQQRLRWLANQPWPQRIGFVRRNLSRLSGRRSPIRWHDQPMVRATYQAVHAYVRDVRTYTGRIVLFLGSGALRRAIYWRQLDWAHVAAGGLEVRIGIDGCIDTQMMLCDPAHVRALGDLLRPYLTGLPPQ